MEQEQTFDDRERPGWPQRSMLDRGLTVPLMSAGFLISALAVILAAALRLPGLDRFAVSPAASRVALTAQRLVEGGDVPRDLLGQPATVILTALAMFVGDANTTLARLAMAFAGLAAIILIAAMRNWLGDSAPLAALLAAISPTLIFAAREIGTASVVVAGAVLLLAGASWVLGGAGWKAFAAAGGALAIVFLSGPLGPVAILLNLPVALLLILQRHTQPGQNELIAALAGFAGTFILITSALFTRPLGVFAATGEIFSQLWEQHLANLGADWHLLLWNLILNEPLLILLAIIGIVLDWDRQVTRVGLVWFVANLIILSLLGQATTTSYALSVLPLVVLASVGLSQVIRRIARSQSRTAYLVSYVVVFILLAFAVLSLSDVLRDAAGESAGRTIARFVMTIIVAVVPLGLAAGWLGRRLSGQRLILIATAALVVVSGFTVRSAVLAASERPANPSAILAQGTMSESVPLLASTLRRLSRDMTSDERDARMPVGGVALHISVDETVADPFRWYFHDFPNLVVFDPSSEPVPDDSQIVILSEQYDPAEIAPSLEQESFVYRYQPLDLYTNPDWGDLLSDMLHIDGWRHFIDFLIHRQAAEAAVPQMIHVLAPSTIADRLFIPSGPYTLSDRPGVGSDAGQFNQPRGVVVDDQGRLYVVDSGNQRVQRFTPDGIFDMSFGSTGSEPGQFAPYPNGPGGPNGIAIGSEGNIFVADTWNHRIQVFSPDGEPLRQWGTYFDAGDDPQLETEHPGGFYGPRGIAIHDGLVYVTDTGNERVQVFTEQGEFVRMFGSIGSDLGQLSEPVGIAVTTDGTVLVADSNNARIARFTTDGQPLAPWPVSAWEEQQYFEPYLTIDAESRVYASDSADGQVIVLSSDGQPLTTIEDPELAAPYGLALADDGNLLYVSDGLANAVIRVTPNIDGEE